MEALMLEDIGLAADELRPVYDATDSLDGWVSIEVAPGLAYDTMATEAEVRRIRALVARPNVLVKVPATAEGVAAIHDLTGSGYSINVTLIFSLERYGEVMEAYLVGSGDAGRPPQRGGGPARARPRCAAWPASS